MDDPWFRHVWIVLICEPPVGYMAKGAHSRRYAIVYSLRKGGGVGSAQSLMLAVTVYGRAVPQGVGRTIDGGLAMWALAISQVDVG